MQIEFSVSKLNYIGCRIMMIIMDICFIDKLFKVV